MKHLLVILSFCILLFASTLNSQIFQNWSARYNGSNNWTDEALGLATDNWGNAFITGVSSGGSSTGWDATTVKYSKCGVQKWLNRYSAGEHDEGRDVVVNSNSDIIVVGESWYDPSFYDFQYLAIKYTNSGSQVWTLNDGPFYENKFNLVVTDNSGNIYAAGETMEHDPAHADPDLVLMKINSSGTVLWTRYYGVNTDEDYLEGLIMGDDGYIYVIGGVGLANASDHFDWATLKYDASGNLIWTAIYDGDAHRNDGPQSIAVDANGNVYVTGVTVEYENPPAKDDDAAEGENTFTTIKYNSSGVQQWVKKYFSPWSTPAARGRSIILINNEPHVSGYARIGNGYDDFVIMKYNTSGTQQWFASYDYAGGKDISVAMKSDNNGDLYVTGKSQSIPNDNDSYDYETVKYNSSGVLQWNMRYNGAANDEDSPSDLRIEDGGIYVTGKSDRDATASINYDYLTVRYGTGVPICEGDERPGDNMYNHVNSLAKINDSIAVSVGNNGEIKRTTDKGISWENIGNFTADLLTIDVSGSTTMISGSEGTILFSSDGGVNWVNKSLPVLRSISSIDIIEGNVFCCGEKGIIYRSSDYGNSWSNISVDTMYNLNSVVFNGNSGFVCGSDGILFKTTNSGENWAIVQTSVSVGLNKIVFINSQNGYILGDEDILLSTTNGGSGWSNKDFDYNCNLNSVCFVNANTGYISGSNGVFLSTYNGGASWEKLSTGSGANLTAITLLDTGRVILATDDGRIFLSNNGEYESNEGGDVFTDSRVTNENIPARYKLMQNYPNPFNPETEIKFSLEENLKTQVIVYDITGRVVKELVNEYKDKGTHNVKFNASQYASGVYFYKIIVYEKYGAGIKYTESKKMVLVK